MSRKTRRTAPPSTSTAPSASSPPDEEPEGDDPDDVLEPGEEDGELAEASPASPVEVLERAGIERSSAVFILAYLHVRPAATPDAGGAKEALAMCALLRAQPWVWSAVLATDYVRFTRALEICGLPLVSIQALQAEVSALTHGKRPSPPAAPAAEQPGA